MNLRRPSEPTSVSTGAAPTSRAKVSLWQVLAAAAVVLWLFAVVLPYYIFHRPFDSDNLFAIANTLGDIAVVALLFVLAAALGHRGLRAFEFASALEASVMQVGVGYGIIAFGVFVLGFAGLLQPIVFWACVLVGLGLLYRDVLALAREWRRIELPRATRLERGLAGFIVVLVGAALLFSLAPPTGWDGLQYHLVLPELALQNGRFLPPPDNMSLSYPALVEMLFLAAMGLKGDTAAQVIHWSYLVLTLGAVLAFAARYFTWRVAWLAAALLVGVPSILLISTYAYNDLALMFYTLTAFWMTLRGIETRKTRDYILAGVLAGLALGEKYTAVFVPLALSILVLFRQGRRLPDAGAWRDAALLSAIALLCGSAWYLRNLLFTGNPVYPFVFGGVGWDSWRAAWYSRFGTGVGLNLFELLSVPYRAAVQGVQGGYFDATVGALLLALLPFNLLKRTPETERAPTRAMWFLVAVLFAFWLVGVAESKLLFQTRLLFPAFPLLAILAAEGWNRLSQVRLPQFDAQRFAMLIVVVALGINLLSVLLATASSRPFDALLGIETREEYLTRQLGDYYAMTRWVNGNLPKDANVALLWEPRSYYIERGVKPDAMLDRLKHAHYLYGDADKIAAEWRKEGITHVVLYRGGLNDMLQTQYDPIDEAEIKTLQELEAKHLKLVYDKTPLELTVEDAKPALTDWQGQPYAVYELH